MPVKVSFISTRIDGTYRDLLKGCYVIREVNLAVV